MFNQYPYLNLNDLNLDYILKAIKEMRYEVTNFVSINAIKYADPIQWNITSQYEKNTIVIDPVTGTAYISVAPVPAGVALTRPEYWTVVFDLGSFVTRAAQNFTSRWESETTLTATFATPAGAWLVWGDVLYKALSNIIAGDTYVVGSNIEHFTIEDLYNAYLNTIANILAMIGDLTDLTTSDTSDIVHAINSVLDDLNVTIGDLANLTSSDKTNIVNAINSVVTDYTAADNAINDKIDNLVGNMKLLGADLTGVVACDDILDTALSNYPTIYFPRGTYYFTRQHDINGHKLMGDNAKLTSASFGLNAGTTNTYGGFNSTYPQMLFNIIGNNSSVSGFIFNTDSGGIVCRADKCNFNNLKFYQTPSIAGSTGYYCLVLRDCASIFIENIYCDLNDGKNLDGIHIEGNTHDVEISNCELHSGDDSLALNALEGAGGDIYNVNVANCFLGGFGCRFFGVQATPIHNVNFVNCRFEVESVLTQSGALRFSDSTNAIGGTYIGDGCKAYSIKFANCEFIGKKPTDLSVYLLHCNVQYDCVNCRFLDNTYYFDADVTVNAKHVSGYIYNTSFSGANMDATMLFDGMEIGYLNKATGRITVIVINCTIDSGLSIGGSADDFIIVKNSILVISLATLNPTGGRVYVVDNITTAPTTFHIENGASDYYISGNNVEKTHSIIDTPALATRIYGDCAISDLTMTAPIEGDRVGRWNGFACQYFQYKQSIWQEIYCGTPQTMADLTADPTMTDFNDLLAKLKTAGIFY